MERHFWEAAEMICNSSLGLNARIKYKIEPPFSEGFDDVRVKLAVYYPPLIRMIVSLSLNSR